MVQRHPSTPIQRAEGVAMLIAHAGEYGVVTQLRHALGVVRQTLSTWCERGPVARPRTGIVCCAPIWRCNGRCRTGCCTRTRVPG